jgi:hypothetical protein
MMRTAFVLAAMLVAGVAEGQAPLARADAIISGRSAIHVGAGVAWRTGTYLRSGVEAGIGATEEGVSGRIDVVNRFHLDPFRESRWAPYAGGGLSARFEDNSESRLYLLVLFGVDGPAKRGLSTSFEAGFGGGARLGVVIRRASAERR